MTRGDATREQKWEIRLACEADIPALEKLIPQSVRELQSGYYSLAQMEAAIGSVFGVDRQLIRDETYFVVESNHEIVGCGGWSRRKKLFGSDALSAAEHELLNPKTDAARIRAFFIHPEFARRGIARVILLACEDAMRAENFTAAEMVATLPGEPFYAAFGYAACERSEVPMANDLTLPVVRMTKQLQTAVCLTNQKIMRKINLNEIKEEERKSPKGKYHKFVKDISIALGREPDSLDLMKRHPFDLALTRIPPGKSYCPYHVESAQFEFYVVISGRGKVRDENNAQHEVLTGDTFYFAPGEAHQLSNDGTEDFVYYVIANNPMNDSCYYPDSKKWMVHNPPTSMTVIKGSETDYYDGEE